MLPKERNPSTGSPSPPPPVMPQVQPACVPCSSSKEGSYTTAPIPFDYRFLVTLPIPRTGTDTRLFFRLLPPPR